MDENVKKAVDELKEKTKTACAGGGAEEIVSQKKKGKLGARERIRLLLDPDSFVEVGMLGALEEDAEKDLYDDGIVAGFGKIDGRKVCLFSQDTTVRKGTFGQVHRLKMTNIMDKARAYGAPMLCLWDGAGGRLERSTYVNPSGYSTFRRFIANSGVIPQLSAILGATAGNASYGPALTDFVFMVDGLSYAFATGPKGTKEETSEEINMEDLGGARVHSELSGLCDRRFKSEEYCLAAMRRLLGYLPQNSERLPAVGKEGDRQPRINEELRDLVPGDGRKPYDMIRVIRAITDDGKLFEIKPEFARNIIAGFARLGGRSVAIVANQPMVMTGAITIDASIKAARFIRFAGCFNIPIVTLVDTTGYMPGSEQEHGGLLRHGAKLPYALSEARVPKIAVLIRKAYGGAKPAMGIDKDLGIDLVYAWPIAESAVMGARGTVKVLYRKEIEEAGNPEEFFRAKVEEFRRAATAYSMAHSTFVDDIIDPARTRDVLIRGLESITSERRFPGPAAHGNIPL